MRRLIAISVFLASTAAACAWAGESVETSTTVTTIPPASTVATTTTTTGAPLPSSERRAALDVVRTFLAAWAAGDHEVAARTAASGQGEVAAQLDAWANGLGLSDLALTITGDTLSPGGGRVEYRAEAVVGGLGPWEWSSAIDVLSLIHI